MIKLLNLKLKYVIESHGFKIVTLCQRIQLYQEEKFI